MHIPDGVLSTPVIATTYVATGAAVWYASKKVKREISEEKLPLLGLMAAGIFVAQMVNFPVMAGVSGHLLGASLVAILFGPYASILVMSSVLIIQTLLFGDGGITAIGANILNMGIIGAIVGFYVYKWLSHYNKTVASSLSGWLAVELGALMASIEIGLSGSIPFLTFLKLMLIYHGIIGIIEGILTSLMVTVLEENLSLEEVKSRA